MYTYLAKVIKITDGDSIRMDVDLGFGCHLLGNDGRGVDIRLHGLDTPEVRTRDRAEKAHGLLAKACVEEHLKVGETYQIITRERGKFGRYLTTIKLKGKRGTINDLLLKLFLAVPYHGENRATIRKLHEKNRVKLRQMGAL
jgi:endonuclease YncB( thermonuclease family)|tara:strand:- start:12234 stop:12659 length:426 start_codon:yes stop_codon:yes gene_type:complete